MAGARRDGAGGITGLVELIDRHGEALEADLQREYRRSLRELHAGTLTFRELSWLIKGLPGDGTALWRAGRRVKVKGAKAVAPPDEFWTAERDLLAGIRDDLALLAWQKTKDGSTGRNIPKPIRRPGVTVPGEAQYGAAPVTIEEFEARLSAARAGEPVDPPAEPDAPEDTQGDAPSGQS